MTTRYQFAGTFPTIIMGAEHGPDSDVSRADEKLVDVPGSTVVLNPGDFISLPDDEIVDPTIFIPAALTPAQKAANTRAANAAAKTADTSTNTKEND